MQHLTATSFSHQTSACKFMHTNLFVVTGGPGVGKTTLINALKDAGFLVVEEDARKIIQAQMLRDGEALPWKNKTLYAKLMLEAAVNSYQAIKEAQPSNPVFFDRGILDAICYMNMENIPISPTMKAMALAHPYSAKVFILPPWKEIYQTDNERKQTWEEAGFTFERMKETYLSYGYEIIELPKADVETRRLFIEDYLDKRTKSKE